MNPLPRFVKFLGVLRTLWKSSPEKRKDLIRHISSTVLKAVLEIALNILKGRVNLDARQLSTFKKHKKILKRLVSSKVSLATKKQLLADNPQLVSAIIQAVLKYVLYQKATSET